MPDYYNPEDPFYHTADDQLRKDEKSYPEARAGNATWAWVAAAAVLVVIFAIAFGISHRPGQNGTNTASNDAMPPAASRMAPPATMRAPRTLAPPVAPTPHPPAQR
jgi:hypothetical protein